MQSTGKKCYAPTIYQADRYFFLSNPDPERKYSWNSLQFSVENDNIENANLNFLNITGSAESSRTEFKVQNGFYQERINFWLNAKVAENIPEVKSSTTTSRTTSTTSCRSSKTDSTLF